MGAIFTKLLVDKTAGTYLKYQKESLILHICMRRIKYNFEKYKNSIDFKKYDKLAQELFPAPIVMLNYKWAHLLTSP